MIRATFKGKTPDAILGDIRSALAGRELGRISTLDLRGSTLTVTLNKMGTSVLTFSMHPGADGTDVALVNEKLALAHRALRGTVEDKLMRLMEKVGGVVTQR